MGMDDVSVTVAVLTFNRQLFTQRCLESILANTARPFRLAVLDNGSTDGSTQYLKDLRERGLVDDLTFNRENRGLSAGKNQLVRHAPTKLVCLLDNDFYCHPGWLERMVKVMMADPTIVAVSPYSAMPDHHPSAVLEEFEVAGERVTSMTKLGGTMLIRRRDFLRVGGFPSGRGRMMHFASTPFWKALLAKKGRRAVTMAGLADHMDEVSQYRDQVADVELACYTSWNRLQKRRLVLPSWDEWKTQVVDVVIPVYGAMHLLERCLEGLRLYGQHGHRVTLVSDKPDDHDAVRQLAERYRTAAIYNDRNRGFPASCNVGWRSGGNPLVCFLNTDCIVGPHAIGMMVWGMMTQPQAGIVGPSTSTCAGLQKVRLADDTFQVTVEDLPELAGRCYQKFGRSVQQANISGFCFLTRRKLLEDLGGFDESYGRGYGEENDFELRAWANGWRSYHVRGAYVHHYGKQSFGTLPAEEVEALKTRNLAKVDARRLEVRAMGRDLASRVVDPRTIRRRNPTFGYPVIIKSQPR